MNHRFDSDKHKYYIDDREVVTVTQVLRDVIPGWMATEWHKQRGQVIHACAALLACGKNFTFDPQIAGQITALRRYFEIEKPVILSIETPVYSDAYMYAGTPDKIVSLPKYGKLIRDYKPSITPALKYQLAAYSIPLGINWGQGVQIGADGRYRLSEICDLRKYRNRWLSLLTAYGIRRECKIEEIEEEP
jgi:hypothetical protein